MTDAFDQVDAALAQARKKAAEEAAASNWLSQLRRSNEGALKPSLFNIKTILSNDPRWAGVIAYDEFGNRIMKRALAPVTKPTTGEWTDLDDVLLRSYLSHEYGIEPKPKDIDDVVLEVAHEHRFHPVREYLASLKHDGTPRVAELLRTYFGAGLPRPVRGDDEAAVEYVKETTYLRIAAVRFMVSAIARIMRPGCKVDTMLVLQGPQGVKKSSGLRALFGEELYTDTKLVLGDKDSIIASTGKWAIEFGEMHAHAKAEDTLFKLHLSSQVDRIRMPYGKRAQDVPRSSVFVGTTNADVFGRDDSGARRTWPVTVQAVDVDALHRDRDQLWAEALQLYQAGERWWIDRDRIAIDPAANERLSALFPAPVSEWDLFEEQANARQIVDAWQYPIVQWLDANNAEPHVTSAQILGGALKIDAARWTKLDQQRVGAILRTLGWKHAKCGPKYARFWAWQRPSGESAPSASAGLGESA